MPSSLAQSITTESEVLGDVAIEFPFPKISSQQKAKVFLIDDDRAVLSSLRRGFDRRNAPFVCQEFSSREEFLSVFLRDRPHVVVLDLELSPAEGPESGLSLIEEIVACDFPVRIVVLTGHSDERFGVEALRRGAASFLSKPPHIDHLLHLVLDSLEYVRLRRIQDDTKRISSLLGFETCSTSMSAALTQATQAAANNLPVLIVGETGTGKGVLAQAIHCTSQRAQNHFVRFQPTFGSSDLTSSELFGHQRGAFTGAFENRQGLVEEANRGTLFLDEVDELPIETQILLLNVLQEKKFRRLGSNKIFASDFRLISATNRPLEELFVSKKLRSDLFHRISHVTIDLPPLRERKEDIVFLSEQFVRELANSEKLTLSGMSADAQAKLQQYQWPGNIRELQAVVQNAVYDAVFHGRRRVDSENIHLPQGRSNMLSTATSFRSQIQQYEFQVVNEALVRCDHNQTKAAESLGLDRSSFRRILNRSAAPKMRARQQSAKK